MTEKNVGFSVKTVIDWFDELFVKSNNLIFLYSWIHQTQCGNMKYLPSPKQAWICQAEPREAGPSSLIQFYNLIHPFMDQNQGLTIQFKIGNFTYLF